MRLPKYYNVDDGKIYRNNAFKNVVMRIVLDVREQAKKPKLADFLSIYKEQLKKTGQNPQEVKVEFQNKFKLLYGYDSSSSSD